MEKPLHTEQKTIAKPSLIDRMRELRLRTVLVLLSLSGITVSMTFFATLTVSNFHTEKLGDYLAVMYLELEQQSSIISRRIQQEPSTQNSFWGFTANQSNSKLLPPSLAFAVSEDLSLKESYKRVDDTTLAAMNLKHAAFSPQYNVLLFGGKTYLSTFTTPHAYQLVTGTPFPIKSKKILLLWQIDIIKFFQIAERNNSTSAYAVTREGKLIYSNSDQITPNSVFDRPLVRKFINSGVNHGQTSFEVEGVKHQGFFYEVPHTNIIVFNETSTDAITKPVSTKVFQYSMYSTGVILILLLVFYILASYITRPLKNLVKIADKISHGDFSVAPKIAGSGEIADLSISFRRMITALKDRDFKLQKAFEEQKDKIRLQGELKVAQHIQKNLLPSNPGITNDSIEIYAKYLPADECGGDWYYYKDFPNHSIFCIADVSGHGVGSAMYTAIIASIFNEHMDNPEKIDIESFAKKVNKAIVDLGAGAWHATLLMGVLEKDSEKLKLLNMGHPPAFISKASPNGETNISTISLPSTPAGLEQGDHFATTILDFPKGSNLFAYSDGLIESKNKSDKSYGMKSLKKQLTITSQDSSELVILKTLENWSHFREGVKPLDDICVLSIRLRA